MIFLGCMEKYCSMLGLTARTLLAHSRMLGQNSFRGEEAFKL
jgi:hypothetical protein